MVEKLKSFQGQTHIGFAVIRQQPLPPPLQPVQEKVKRLWRQHHCEWV